MSSSEERRAVRKPFIADVDLIINAKTLKGMTVDVSELGVRIDMSTPLEAMIRFVIDGQLQDRKARLARVEHTLDGGMTYGLEFIDE